MTNETIERQSDTNAAQQIDYASYQIADKAYQRLKSLALVWVSAVGLISAILGWKAISLLGSLNDVSDEVSKARTASREIEAHYTTITNQAKNVDRKKRQFID